MTENGTGKKELARKDTFTRIFMRYGAELTDMLEADGNTEALALLNKVAQAAVDKFEHLERQNAAHLASLLETYRQRNMALDRIEHLERLLDEITREIENYEAGAGAAS